jgi:hypothetical protein
MSGRRNPGELKRDTEVDAVASLFLWVKGSTAGGLVFLVGLGLVHFLVRTRFVGEAALAASSVGRWRVSAWLYYNAHLVPTEGITFERATVVAEAGNSLARLAADDSSLFVAFLLPPALLVVTGYAVAKRRPKNVHWLRAGLATFVGYFFVAVVFMLIASIQPEGPVQGVPTETEFRPNPWYAIGLAAIAYPAVFALVGAILGRRTAWNRPSRQGKRQP